MTHSVRKLAVELGNRSYEILIGSGLLDQLGEFAQQERLSNQSVCMIVTDEHVAGVGYLAKAVNSLERSGYKVEVAIIPPGETSKSYGAAEALFDQALAAGLDRHSTIFALGGGVVGDLAGFVAATYMRGISFVQIPTTILAHDSSVGGKVAVNHPKGKNIIGAFHQPRLVVFDTDTLATLPLREIRSGLAEVVKHGLIWDAAFFNWLEASLQQILNLDSHVIGEMLVRSCTIKAQVVANDETEQHMRAILNFGHTLAHAIEALSNYRSYTHGEAVAIGMVYAARLSNQLGMFDEQAVERIRNILLGAGLPVQVPSSMESAQLIQLMKQDKKAAGGQFTFVLLDSIGKAVIKRGIELEMIRSLLEAKGGVQA